MTTGAWCMLINRWCRKYACLRSEKKEKVWVTETCQTELTEISKKKSVTKFVSPHKSPNRMWYMLQKVWLEKRCIWYKGEEIGTILHMVWQQARFLFFFFWLGRGARFVSVTPTVNSWGNSPPAWASSILQRTWAIGCWIYITKDPEVSQRVKVQHMIKQSHQIKYIRHQYLIEQIFETWTRHLLGNTQLWLKIFFCWSLSELVRYSVISQPDATRFTSRKLLSRLPDGIGEFG